MGQCGDIAKYTLLCSRLREAFDGYAAWRPDVARRPSSARSALESEITAVTRGRSLCIAAKTLYPTRGAPDLRPRSCALSRRRAVCCQRRARSGRRVCYSQAVAPLAGGRAFHIPRVARRTGCASVTGPKLGPKLAARFSRQKLYPQRATRGLQIQSGT